MSKPENSKPVIAVDIDEVLSPLHDLVFAHHNEIYGTNYPIRDPKGSYFINHYTGETHEETVEKLKKFIQTEAFKNIQPLKGAIETIVAMKQKFNLVIITGRQNFYYDITHSWLTKHFPDVFSDVYFTEYVANRGHKIPKAKLCLEAGARYLIDDDLNVAQEAAKAGIEAILFGDYPWNQGAVVPGVIRVSNWQEVAEHFNV